VRNGMHRLSASSALLHVVAWGARRRHKFCSLRASRCAFVLVALLVGGAAAFAQGNPTWSAALAEGSTQAARGDLTLALKNLEVAQRAAVTPYEKARAAGAFGAALVQARRYDEADAQLREAYDLSAGPARARYAADLGNLAALRKRQKEAKRYYLEARALATDNPEIRLVIDLNLVRLAPENERLTQLDALLSTVGMLPDSQGTALLYLNIGIQARSLGPAGVPLAYRSLNHARRLLVPLGDSRALVEDLDALAQLYEEQGRADDAVHLTREALATSKSLAPNSVADVVINLEWRQGRLLRAAKQDDLALAAYQRAVDQIEAVRQDIPIEYEDGRSSFQSTLGPIYLGLVDLMLNAADQQAVELKEARLRRTIAIIELIKQTEMQDFLGDRCAVESMHAAQDQKVVGKTAVLYPILLPDRIELLLDTEAGLVRRSVMVSAKTVQSTTRAFADILRNGAANYLVPARQLYAWLLEPFEAVLDERPIDTLIFVPDGVLRLIPIAALYDGRQFVLEKYATSTVIGMSMTNGSVSAKRRVESLVSGMSKPGPVVTKLDEALIRRIMGTAEAPTSEITLAENRSVRSPRARVARGLSSVSEDSLGRDAVLRDALALPSVKDEIDTVGNILHGKTLLNETFTVDRFRSEASSGMYQIVHIASHGVFGGTARSSYIMAYDDLLTLEDLQTVLRSEKFQNNPVELLSLSACETAEGDDRSPLGISGAAIKARAKSVLGTLWPVEDHSAMVVMERFYTGIGSGQLSKAQALREAQLAIMRTKDRAQPFFWAPFVLIGNWF
jgi:CHAT domain-containing protein